MTVERLSAYSVKVQLSADELRVFLSDEPPVPGSPQMMRMLSFMMAKAEAVSGIAFSTLPVTVELLNAQDGSLSAYFSVQESKQNRRSGKPRMLRLAARFSEPELLRQCCALLQKHSEGIRSSVLYSFRSGYVLTLKLRRSNASAVHHILLEYGKPFRMSAINRARLAEYGICIFSQDAVMRTASEAF